MQTQIATRTEIPIRMRPRISVESRGHGVRATLGHGRLLKLAEKTAHIASVRTPFELSVAFIPAHVSSRMNGTYRKKPFAADVLSFPMGRAVDGTLSGEILLCPSVIRRRTAMTGRTLQSEAERLFVHGLLHVLGIHHATTRQTRRMEALERRVFSHAPI